ncbi:uncharacterized protein LOC116349306 [Contarinia nasturtii]|uniref:uncharacterized protein LOC116349306 n=1 Tax=Contarinia nasturtii TaxID=265458 RepID=UPI0012D42B0A|nr:uncharacterized protein LOC116349306 [Contarinia nasturtii]
MESFSIFPLLALLLCVQSINGQDLSFDVFLDTYYNRANASGNNIPENLEFMREISLNIDHIRDQFSRCAQTLADEEGKANLLSKVPAGLKVNGLDGVEFWTHRLSNVNGGQKLVWETHQGIINEIDSVLPVHIDPHFYNNFYNWCHHPFDGEQCALIQTKWLKSMAGIHSTFGVNLDKVTKEVFEVKETLSKNISQANDWFDVILNANTKPAKVLEAFKKVEPFTNTITSVQSLLLPKLKNVKKLLNLYNQQRTIWANFMMGLITNPDNVFKRRH